MKKNNHYIFISPYFVFIIFIIQSSITVSLALIIEASLEAYFQFWLQSNYSLPDILAIDVTDLEELVTFNTVSILLSFITITVSIVKIRYILISQFYATKMFFK